MTKGKSSNQNTSKDEAVDGAKVAAEILKAMPTQTRERLMRKIASKDPSISIKVSQNLFNFNDIASLTSQGLQALIASVDQKDLVISFKTASDEVKEIFLTNMTDRKRRMITEDFQSLGKVKLSEVEDAQKRILKILDDLRTSGQIRSKGKNDVWV